MTEANESGVERVRRLLAEAGVPAEVRQMEASTRTAAEAAAAIGCTVAQIAKSIVFKRVNSGGHVLVIASGVNRVNESRLPAIIGEGIGKADAAFVRERTGYVIGGVAPVGHAYAPAHVVIDSALSRLDPIWAAAGHTHAVFRLTYAQLLTLTGGTAAEIV